MDIDNLILQIQKKLLEASRSYYGSNVKLIVLNYANRIDIINGIHLHSAIRYDSRCGDLSIFDIPILYSKECEINDFRIYVEFTRA